MCVFEFVLVYGLLFCGCLSSCLVGDCVRVCVCVGVLV